MSRRRKPPSPATAIIIGPGLLSFGLFYYFVSIFLYRAGFSRDAMTAAEDPTRFGLAVLVTLGIGVACLVWGLLQLRKR